MYKKTALIILAIVIAVVALGFVLERGRAPISVPVSGKLRVVAAENFWGSIVSEIGGTRVDVTSVVSDPNADPHEYESNTNTALAFANANYVIINGAGYDSWANKLIAANPSPNRKVLNVATLLGKKNGDNPHFWYNPDYVNKAAAEIESDLISLDPSGKQYYEAQYKIFQDSISEYQGSIALIKQKFAGTKIAATEDIFVYLANATGLDLISPPAFMQAVAEGNDPPAQSLVEFENQLRSKEPAVLVYNEQTATPLTDNMKKLAAEERIPIVGITETVQPPDASFEEWMNVEIMELENALNSNKLGQ
ncbi:MAG: zinc ABC transporter substrate-binding protein [Patescibacteria group bacterium]|nr:zinc ABC transporter substrate-binding protein [Patescibacteria group bacterium]